MGGRAEQFVKTLQPAKTEETVSHRQNNGVSEVGTSPVPSNLSTSLTAVSTAVRNKVTKTVSEKQLLRLRDEDDRFYVARVSALDQTH